MQCSAFNKHWRPTKSVSYFTQRSQLLFPLNLSKKDSLKLSSKIKVYIFCHLNPHPIRFELCCRNYIFQVLIYQDWHNHLLNSINFILLFNFKKSFFNYLNLGEKVADFSKRSSRRFSSAVDAYWKHCLWEKNFLAFSDKNILLFRKPI